MTGPFYIENAEPGDAILVHLRKVRLNRNWGYTATGWHRSRVLPEYVESMYPNHYKADLVRKGRDNILPWDLDLKTNTVKLREPASGKIKLEFPARPMLGCIGVAATGDFSPTSGPSGSYGGNLDYNEIAEGATVILPVYHKGALLFMGDGHAIMADGEPTGTGVETSMDVEFSRGDQEECPRERAARGDRRLHHQPGIAAGIYKFARPRPADGHYRHGPVADRRLPARAVGGPPVDRRCGQVRCRDRRRHHGAPDSEEVFEISVNTSRRKSSPNELVRVLSLRFE